MQQYHDALQHVLDNGEECSDRTGVGTRSIFGHQMRFDLTKGFPAVTTKKLAWRAVVGELLWFLEGSTDERRLAEITFEKDRTELVGKNTIWTANADAQGKGLGYTNTLFKKELGPVYGYQWRNFAGSSWQPEFYGQVKHGFDQIEWLINEIKTNPDSRRLILSAWSAGQIHLMALPPCHTMSQFRVINGKLSCHLYQRSADMFLGVPFNIASYALLTHMIAAICDLEVADFVWTGGDVHIYTTHTEQVRLQLDRTPLELPKLEMPDINSLDDVLKSGVKDYVLLGYTPMESIKAPMAI
jgi:thymidylate synthase